MTKDPDGNEYQYDLDNRIWKIEMYQGATVEFLYDATGRRVQRKEGSTEIAYLWWGDQECSEHKHQSGQAVIQNDLWAHPTILNTIIARAIDGSKFKMEWYHKNYLDNVYAVSDDNGNIKEHYRYSAFGIVEFYNPAGTQIANSQITNPVLWNSRRYDESTKLHYYKYRHYTSKLGRWLSRDPIEEDGGINLYEFVRNNVLIIFDKYGLKAGEPEYLKDDSSKDLGFHGENLEIMGDSDFSFGKFAGIFSDKPDENECYSMSFNVASAYYAIYYDKGSNPDDPNDLDALQNTTRQHEEKRKSIFQKQWKSFAEFADPYERKYCTKNCAEIAKNIASIYHLLGAYGNEFDQQSFTLSSHYTDSKGKIQMPKIGAPGFEMYIGAVANARDADAQIKVLNQKLDEELKNFSEGDCKDPCPKNKDTKK
jgi:RHS repeat-associated protein